MDEDKQFIVKLHLGSCRCQAWDFKETPYAYALVVLGMLNLDTYSYAVDFYYRRELSATYSGSVRPVGVHLDWRDEYDVMKTLPPIVKRKVERPKK